MAEVVNKMNNDEFVKHLYDCPAYEMEFLMPEAAKRIKKLMSEMRGLENYIYQASLITKRVLK